MHYDGRYQMGAAAKTDGSKYAGVPDPNTQTIQMHKVAMLSE